MAISKWCKKTTWKMTETLAYRYSFESTQRELSNEYQYDRDCMVFENKLHPCALDESNLSIGRVVVSFVVEEKGESAGWLISLTQQGFHNHNKSCKTDPVVSSLGCFFRATAGADFIPGRRSAGSCPLEGHKSSSPMRPHSAEYRICPNNRKCVICPLRRP